MTDLADTLIEQEEGCKLTAYRDSLGKFTVGVGHLLPQDQDWTGYTITQAQCDQFLGEDTSYARILATEFPYFDSMNDVRQAVCISLCFQLGRKIFYWPQFMAAMYKQDYTAAAQAGLDSEWAKVQTPKRAQREMAMLSSGVWVNQGDTI